MTPFSRRAQVVLLVSALASWSVPGLARAQERLDTLVPVVPLWHEDSVAVVSRRLQDFEPSPHGFFTPLARARQVGP